MRKIWLISIVAFVFLAMAACASLHTASGQRIYRVRGTVEAYDPGKMIKLASRLEVEGYSDEGDVQKVTPSGPDEFTFAIAPDADVKGTIKPNERVLIRYTQAGAAKIAVSIERVWAK
jgi:hypothetical protein